MKVKITVTKINDEVVSTRLYYGDKTKGVSVETKSDLTLDEFKAFVDLFIRKAEFK